MRKEKENFTTAQGATELAGENEVKLHLSFPFLSFPLQEMNSRSEVLQNKNFHFVERLRFKLLVLTKVLHLEGKKACQDPSESLRVDRNYSPETCKVLRTIGFQPRF